jgi:V8-like Glu-specific endopeptidase
MLHRTETGRPRGGAPSTGAIAAIVLAGWLAPTQAGAEPHVATAARDVQSTAGYWTAERMRNARPLPLPRGGSFSAQATLDSVEQTEAFASGDESEGAEGQEPTDRRSFKPRKLFDPANDEEAAAVAAEEDAGVQPADRGTSGANFTSSRLVPLSADREYPYRTVGKLFFTKPAIGDFVCSASVIKPRLIVTAGHCVHSGSGGTGGFFTNFRFVPAFRDGVAPFGTWNWSYVIVTGTWSSGGGSVPNAADYAVIELQDRLVGTAVRRVGDLTGWLGYQTLSLGNNHAHQLGYPCNVDGCQKLHQVTAQSFRAVSPNNVEYGSDARGGVSGGAWVQNFGSASGFVGGLSPGRNRVIGVTSYTYNDSAKMLDGGSILDSRFANSSNTGILNIACSRRAGNC